MKRCDEPIQVECRDGLPCRIIRARRLLRGRAGAGMRGGTPQPVVHIADAEHYDGKWWQSNRLQPRSRRTYLIETRDRATGATARLEIYLEGSAWRLAAIQD